MLLRRHSEGLKGSRSFAQDVFAGLRARPADTLGRSRSLLDVPHSSNALHPRSLVRQGRMEGTWEVGVSSRVPSCPGVTVSVSRWRLPRENPGPVCFSGPFGSFLPEASSDSSAKRGLWGPSHGRHASRALALGPAKLPRTWVHACPACDRAAPV